MIGYYENVSLECNAVGWREGHRVTQLTGDFGAEFYHMETNYYMKKKSKLIFFKRCVEPRVLLGARDPYCINRHPRFDSTVVSGRWFETAFFNPVV